MPFFHQGRFLLGPLQLDYGVKRKDGDLFGGTHGDLCEIMLLQPLLQHKRGLQGHCEVLHYKSLRLQVFEVHYEFFCEWGSLRTLGRRPMIRQAQAACSRTDAILPPDTCPAALRDYHTDAGAVETLSAS